MNYLLEEDYSKIIEKAISTNTEKVGYFFYSEYVRVKESNFDFVESLTKTITDLEIRYNEEKEKLIERESEKEIRLKGYCETDFRNTIDWNETIFWYYNGKIFFEFNIYWKENQYKQFSFLNLDKLKTGLDKFKVLINDSINDEEIIIDTDLINKIKWKGKSAELGFLIIELLGKGWIDLPGKSFKSNSDYLLKIFDVDTTIDNLANEINVNRNSLTIDNQKFLTLKNRKV